MLDDLLLLRLLAAPEPARGEVRSQIKTDLRPYADAAALAGATERLASSGHLFASGRAGARLRLTDSGRERVRAAFSLPAGALESRHGWAWWRDRFAVPRALGARHFEDADGLRAAMLRRFYLPELPAGGTPGSLAATVDLLLAKRLGAARSGPAGLRQAALRAWAGGGGGEMSGRSGLSPEAGGGGKMSATSARLPAELAAFAALARETARGCPTGRFGERIFISHVWAGLLAAGRAAPDEADAFKDRLTRANTAGLLRLGRADLAGAHDVHDVRASETRYLGETFHFLRLD